MGTIGSMKPAENGASRFSASWSLDWVLASLLLSGCLAQQADLAQVKRDLDKKIARLDQRAKEIEGKADEANRQIDKIKKDADQLVSETRARQRHEMADLRDDSPPKIQVRLAEPTP